MNMGLTTGPNGYPIPDPNPKFFSIPDPYPICFQNHRVFRVSGIAENYIFDMENVVKELQDINLYHLISSSFDYTILIIFHILWSYFIGTLFHDYATLVLPWVLHATAPNCSKIMKEYHRR